MHIIATAYLNPEPTDVPGVHVGEDLPQLIRNVLMLSLDLPPLLAELEPDEQDGYADPDVMRAWTDPTVEHLKAALKVYGMAMTNREV